MRGGESTLLIAFLAILGTTHILVRTASYGTAITTDSTVFLSTALNFLAGQGWRDFAGNPSVEWPPLFPLLLVAFGWVGIDPLAAGRYINATAFGLIIFAAGCWLRSNLRSRWLVLAATATIATSLSLSDWASNFRTDILFYLFTLLALIQLAAVLKWRTDAPLWWAAVFTALAALTRYPGVVLIGVGVLLLLVRRTPPLAVRLKHAVVFGAVSSFPLALVLMYNWAVSGHLTGPRRNASGQSLSDGLSQTVNIFREWVVPPNAPDWLGYLLWLAFGAVGLAGAAVVLRGGRAPTRDAADQSSFGGWYDPKATPSQVRLGPALLFGVFAKIYIVLMVVVPLFALPVGIESRYLLPVYVPLLLAAAFLLDRFLSSEATGRMAAIRYGLVPLVLLGALAHIGFSARENLHYTAQAQVAGYPAQAYNAARWQHSETMNYIRDHRMKGKIYSNAAPLAWFASRIAAPGKYAGLPTWFKAGTHIVWFRESPLEFHYGPHLIDFHLLPGVEPVAELADGVVFRVTAAGAFDPKSRRARKQRYVQGLIERSGEQVIRADWDVYRNGRKLTYRKKPCAPADVLTSFVLQVSPIDPAGRQPHDFDNFDFYFFRQAGVWLDDQCVVTAQLPGYAIDRIRVGQWSSNGNRTLWDAEFSPAGG